MNIDDSFQGANTINLIFNEAVKVGSGNFVLSNDQGDMRKIAVIDGSQVSIVADEPTHLIIAPSKPLVDGSQYTLQIESGAVTDRVGNAFNGIQHASSISFPTPPIDSSPPVLDINDASQVSINGKTLVINLGEDLPRSLGLRVDTVLDAPASWCLANRWSDYPSHSDASAWGRCKIEIINLEKSVRLQEIITMPTNPFIPNTTFYPKNANDTVPLPVPIDVYPAHNATQVPIGYGLQVAFDQPIVQGRGNFIISNGQGDTQIISVNDGNHVFIYDRSLSILPLKDLTPDSHYSVQMEAGALTDVQGRPLAAVMDSTAYNFTTAAPLEIPIDQASPAVTSVNFGQSKNNDSNGNTNNNLWITFDEAIKRGSGKITLSNDQGDTRVIDMSDINQINVNGASLSINPAKPLLADSSYHLLADAGVITDLFGNATAKLTDPNAFVFGVYGDHQPPLLDASGLYVNNSGVAVTFNEAIKFGSSMLTLINSQGRQTIDVRDSRQVQFGDAALFVTPNIGLLAGDQYQLLLESGIVKDWAGNAFQAPGGPLTFTVPALIPPDTSAPLVISTRPTDEQGQVALDSDIHLTFDEAVNLTGAGHFIISNGQDDTRSIAANDKAQVRYGTRDYGGGKIFEDRSQVIINPAQNLVANSRYVVRMESDTVKDMAGNPVAAVMDSQALNFSTPTDASAPIALSTTPADNSLNVAVDSDITVVFNEAIRAGLGNITLFNGQGDTRVIASNDSYQVKFDGTQLTINPSEDLLAGVSYSVQADAGAIVDLAGNPFGAVTDPGAFNFTTAPDTRVPNFLFYGEYFSESLGTQVIQLNFNEGLKLGTGNLILSNDQGDVRTIAVTDDRQVNILGSSYQSKVVEITPIPALLPESRYSLKIEPGAFSDNSGNAFAGIQDSTTIGFTPSLPPSSTPDLTAPVLESSYLDSAGVLRLYFSETIKTGSGHLNLTNDANDSRVIDIHDSSQVVIDGLIITINPNPGLTGGKVYTAQLDSGLVTDGSGNAYQGEGIVTFEASFKPAANQAVQEINHGGTQGVYDNGDVVMFNFNGPAHWQGALWQQHQAGDSLRLDGDYPVQFSQDSLSASITLTETSQFAHGDIIRFTGISGEAGDFHEVAFTL